MGFFMVTNEFRVDQYDNVYDQNGEYYCQWIVLTEDEQETVKQNDFSAK